MAKEPAPSDLADKFMLRLPDGMRDELKTIAAENGRSLNAEIVTRLQQSLTGPKRTADLRVTIDATGVPISWDEIRLHASAIMNLLPRDVISVQMEILSPEMVSSRRREAETEELAQWYKAANATRQPD